MGNFQIGAGCYMNFQEGCRGSWRPLRGFRDFRLHGRKFRKSLLGFYTILGSKVAQYGGFITEPNLSVFKQRFT